MDRKVGRLKGCVARVAVLGVCGHLLEQLQPSLRPLRRLCPLNEVLGLGASPRVAHHRVFVLIVHPVHRLQTHSEFGFQQCIWKWRHLQQRAGSPGNAPPPTRSLHTPFTALVRVNVPPASSSPASRRKPTRATVSSAHRAAQTCTWSRSSPSRTEARPAAARPRPWAWPRAPCKLLMSLSRRRRAWSHQALLWQKQPREQVVGRWK